MIAPLIFVVALVLLFIYIRNKLSRHFSYWKNLNIPCDEPSWTKGNLKDVIKIKSFLALYQEYYDKHRNSIPFVGFFWFFKPSVFVTDPDLVKHILIKDFSKFTDRVLYHNEDDDPIGGHLFNLDGIKWRNMRYKIAPAFTSGKMKNMFPLVTDIGEQCVQVFRESLERNKIVEVKDIMTRFTIDVIATCAFGLQINSLQKPDAEFRRMSHKAFTEQRGGILGLVFRFSFPELSRRLHLKETVPEVEKFLLGIVRNTVDYREKNNIRRNDFMDMLIDLKNNKLMKTETGEDMKNLTFEEVAAQASVFLLAGFETSATTLGYALYELAQHQDIQERAREEIREVLQKHNNEFTYVCMKEMVYVKQVILETLRMYTIVPILNRRALEDYEVPGHPNYVIKKGMPIIIPAAAMHRDERYYPHPHQFDPDNFSPDKVEARDSVLYLPFGDGPRNCIGMRFGKMETVVALSLLLSNFKFSTCKDTQIPIKYDLKSFVASSEGGIYLNVEQI